MVRKQLTLFVDIKDALTIEMVRKEFNPVQFYLIKAHVTLCREDEILDLEKVISNIQQLIVSQPSIIIKFDKVSRFENGNGLYLPALDVNIGFDNLRKQVLFGISDMPRPQKAHITLMHPRNSACTDEIFCKVEKIDFPTILTFNKISLIEQFHGGQWKVTEEFEFRH